MLLTSRTLLGALKDFEVQCAKAPVAHTTLCEVRLRRTGRLVGYRVLCDRYLTSLPQPRSEFLVPLWHQ